MEDKMITIYTSTTCPYCDMAKDYFRTKGIPFEEKSTAEPENRKKLVSMGIRGVPAIFIGNKHFVGFDPMEIERLMNESDTEDHTFESEPVVEDVLEEPTEAGLEPNEVVSPQAETKTPENAGSKEENKNKKEEVNMTKYICQVCGYVYDPADGDTDNGIAPGTSFDALPEDWVCPLCGVGKDQFEAE